MTLKLTQLNQITRTIAFVDGTTIGLIDKISDAMFSQVGFEKKYFISRDQDFYKKFLEIEGYVIKDMKRLERLIDTPEKSELLAGVMALYHHYLSLVRKEFDLGQKAKKYPQEEYREGRSKTVDKINKELRKIVHIARLDRDKKIYTSSQTTSHILDVTAITAGLSSLWELEFRLSIPES